MNRKGFLYGFDLNDNLILNNQINSVAAIQRLPFVMEWQN